MGQVVGFQITANDENALSDFYASVFGWGKTPGPHEHVVDLAAGLSGGSGSVIGRGEHLPAYVSLVLAVEDLNATLEAVQAHGGTVVRQPFTLPNGDTLAIAEDPEGYVVTLTLQGTD